MDIKEARQLAAQAWCTEETSHIVMDTILAEAFAQILVKVTEPPLPNVPGKRCCETTKEGKSLTRIQWNK